MTQFTQQTQKRIDLAVEVYKAFNKNYHWLKIMVANGDISKSEAGYIISMHG